MLISATSLFIHILSNTSSFCWFLGSWRKVTSKQSEISGREFISSLCQVWKWISRDALSLCSFLALLLFQNALCSKMSGHRAFWNNNNAKKEHNDRASLLIHFQTWHKELMNSLPDISDCFEVTFLQEPRNQQKLDVLESMWINKLVAEININKTILPKYH